MTPPVPGAFRRRGHTLTRRRRPTVSTVLLFADLVRFGEPSGELVVDLLGGRPPSPWSASAPRPCGWSAPCTPPTPPARERKFSWPSSSAAPPTVSTSWCRTARRPTMTSAPPSPFPAPPSTGKKDDAAIDLDGFFGLHPSLASLKPLFDQQHLAIVDAVGSPDPTRSHFDAQDYMESGTPGRKATQDGWMNRALPKAEGKVSPVRAVSLGPVLPRAMRGQRARGRHADHRGLPGAQRRGVETIRADVYRLQRPAHSGGRARNLRSRRHAASHTESAPTLRPPAPIIRADDSARACSRSPS